MSNCENCLHTEICARFPAFEVQKYVKENEDECPRFEETGGETTKYGEWIPDDYEYCRCSECGFEYDEPECKTPYCPSCGARMEGKEI